MQDRGWQRTACFICYLKVQRFYLKWFIHIVQMRSLTHMVSLLPLRQRKGDDLSFPHPQFRVLLKTEGFVHTLNNLKTFCQETKHLAFLVPDVDLLLQAITQWPAWASNAPLCTISSTTLWSSVIVHHTPPPFAESFRCTNNKASPSQTGGALTLCLYMCAYIRTRTKLDSYASRGSIDNRYYLSFIFDWGIVIY